MVSLLAMSNFEQLVLPRIPLFTDVEAKLFCDLLLLIRLFGDLLVPPYLASPDPFLKKDLGVAAVEEGVFETFAAVPDGIASWPSCSARISSKLLGLPMGLSSSSW